jgi:hypothetical protein
MMRIAAGIIAALMVAIAAYAGTADKRAGRVAMPVVKIERGEQCVAPVEEMRRNHMAMLLHQRDRTVHQGERKTRHSLKGCIDCHASEKTGSVLGKDGFCSSCHTYASVKIDCFECHTPLRPSRTAGGRQ